MNRNYSIVELEQGSDEWLQWRHDGIGGSEASTIMGENRFESARALLESKCRPPRSGRMTIAMMLGVKLEPHARSSYNERFEAKVRPACLQNNQRDWLRASLDGITADGSKIVEIKCGKSAYRRTEQTGRPPAYYYGQLQHAMAVADLDSIDFYCYFPPGRPILLTVPRSQSYIDNLLEREEAFWITVLERRQQSRIQDQQDVGGSRDHH